MGPSAPTATLAVGARVGPFQIIRRLGAGGMGEVWLAERVEGGFSQQVAIKCLRGDSASLLARFEAERAILASLAHPGIARLYDGGVTSDRRPYMVLEYIKGEDLVTWCQRTGAGLDQRLSLFLDVCDAVSYAHTQLVVHRDIKPANILVTADGRVKLLDFGIAKLLDPDALGDATVTGHRQSAARRAIWLLPNRRSRTSSAGPATPTGLPRRWRTRDSPGLLCSRGMRGGRWRPANGPRRCSNA